MSTSDGFQPKTFDVFHLTCDNVLWYFAVLKYGMYCSVYEVMGKSKQENSLSGLLQRLERERMVSSFRPLYTLIELMSAALP